MHIEHRMHSWEMSSYSQYGILNCCLIVNCVYQGVNVREKAKQLVTLLKDEERLREERIHALKTKEKMAQTSSGEYFAPHLLVHLLRADLLPAQQC